MAEEPTTWAELFTEEAKGIRPAPGRASSLLKSYRYACTNFGAAISVTAVQKMRKWERRGFSTPDAHAEACKEVFYDFVASANEDRVDEFLLEFPSRERRKMREVWLEAVRRAGDAADVARQNAELDQEK